MSEEPAVYRRNVDGDFSEEALENEPPIGLEMDDYTLDREARYAQCFKEPDFENHDKYYRFWLRVMLSIQRNTGVIRRWVGRRSLKVQSLGNWMTLLEGKRTSVDDFRRHCYNKGYLGVMRRGQYGEFETMNVTFKLFDNHQVFWFANPEYVWNGAKLPKHVHDYFGRAKKIVAKDYKGRLAIPVSSNSVTVD